MNDTHGHVFGDTALKYLAKTLLATINNDGYLFRLGGDEFALLFQYELTEEIIQNTVNELRLLPKPHDKQNTTIQMHISAGVISVKPTQAASLDALYQQADKALYVAKSNDKEKNKQSHVVSKSYSEATRVN